MKIKNHFIYNSLDSIKILSKFQFKGVVIYKLAKLLNIIEEQCNFLEFTKNKLILKYGDNGAISPNHLNFKPFLKEWSDVLTEELEINIEKIKLSDLNLDNNSIPVEVISKLDWFIEQDF